MSFPVFRYYHLTHWSLSDSKCPQASWILLSILAVLNNNVAFMVSILSLMSCLFILSPCPKPLGDRSKRTNNNWYYRTFMFRSLFFFSFEHSYKIQAFDYFFVFSFLLCGLQKQKNPKYENYFLFS